MGSPVSLVSTTASPGKLKDSISAALTGINFKPSGHVKTVVIKPNLCYYWDSSTGNTTDPKLVSAIIDYVREKFGEDVSIKVAEADASAMRTKYVFPVLGYDRLAAEKNVQLVNLSADELVETTIKVDGYDLTFKIPQILLKSDLFINVPKLKVMKASTITCAMKNLFGANGIPRKAKYHKHLYEAIVGINKILHPQLTIVDGVIALGSCPIRLDLIMAGTDTFSIDWVASQVMGFSPSRIPFLKLAIKEKVGSTEGIEIVGEKPGAYSKIFPKPRAASSKYIWGIQFALLKAYKKVSGDIIPPMLEE
jgi:uncharacterized protein (DUF362 family)